MRKHEQNGEHKDDGGMKHFDGGSSFKGVSGPHKEYGGRGTDDVAKNRRDFQGKGYGGKLKSLPRGVLHGNGGSFVGGGRGSVTGIVSGGFRGVIHELPYRSLTLFLATFTVATAAGILVVPVGVAVSGSVWTVLVSTGFVAIVLAVTCVVSLANFVHGLISALSTSLSSGRGGDDSVSVYGALFRGYFGGIIQVGCILLVYEALRVSAWGLFAVPMVYVIPIEVLGCTVPIPIPLGFSGMYISIAVHVVATVVLVASFLMGGIEMLQAIRAHVDDGEDGSSLYRSALYLLFLTVFPALNILLCCLLISAYAPIIGAYTPTQWLGVT